MLLIYQFLSINYRQSTLLYINICLIVYLSELAYKLSIPNLVQYFSKSIYRLLVYRDLFYYNVTSCQLLLNIPKASINILSSTVRRRLCIVSNISCQLIILVDSYQPYYYSIELSELVQQFCYSISFLRYKRKLNVLGLS